MRTIHTKINRVIAKLERPTHIDLAWATSDLFRTMGRDAAKLWPGLNVVSASDLRYKDVKEFLDARESNCKGLEELCIHFSEIDSDDKMDLDEIDLLRQRVGKLALDPALEYPLLFSV